MLWWTIVVMEMLISPLSAENRFLLPFISAYN
nr:MAG TPA: hypothetical protein [Caudoviricetes sp.]